MLKPLAAVSAFACASAVVYAAYRLPAKPGAVPGRPQAPSSSATGAAPISEAAGSTTAHERELRELQQAMLRAVLTTPGQPQADDAFAAARARKELLDTRMTAAPASPELTRDLQEALDVLRTTKAGEGVSLDFRCGGAMCRVDLKSQSGNADQAVEALLDHLPKVFASTSVLSTSAEQRALYAANDPSSLRVAPPGATQIVLPRAERPRSRTRPGRSDRAPGPIRAWFGARDLDASRRICEVRPAGAWAFCDRPAASTAIC